MSVCVQLGSMQISTQMLAQAIADERAFAEEAERRDRSPYPTPSEWAQSFSRDDEDKDDDS